MNNSAPPDTAPGDWITPGEAARRLGISPQRVSNLVDSGDLVGYRPTTAGGRSGHRRVSLASVHARLGGSCAGSSGRGDDVA